MWQRKGSGIEQEGGQTDKSINALNVARNSRKDDL
jgi:hypothetical protein